MKKKEKSLLVKLREVPVVETRCCYQSLVSSCLGISFSHSRTCPTPPRSINRWTEIKLAIISMRSILFYIMLEIIARKRDRERD